ncbi:MAG: histidine kinase [Leptospiraceae bacterium]|nr:histidine kinase [Leptospiraceae bacterium]MCP5502003.1 histidine kinase [Leptospiraceae bacterium]
MPTTMIELDDKIKKMIYEREKISIKSSKINSEFEKYLLSIITEVLSKHKQERYVDLLYTIAKELSINAIKANQKRIFFEDHKLDITNDEDYIKGLALYKSKFSESLAEEYGKKCQQKGIFVRINFFYTEDGMYIEVINNTPVIKTEEIRLREKMKKAMVYNDIAEFYMDNMDNSEGAGLGIALTMILLKNENIDPNLFRIITRSTETIARIELPFTDNYISIRSIETKD